VKDEWGVACEEVLNAEESESIWQFFNVNLKDDRGVLGFEAVLLDLPLVQLWHLSICVGRSICLARSLNVP